MDLCGIEGCRYHGSLWHVTQFASRWLMLKYTRGWTRTGGIGNELIC